MKSMRGAALTEYGLLTGLVALVAIAAVAQLGDEVDSTFTTVGSSLSGIAQSDAAVGPEAEGEAEAAGPPPPTGPAAMSFTVTLDSASRGYGHGSLNNRGIEEGTIEAYDGVPSHLIQLRYEAGSSRVFFRVAGDFASELADHTLTCDDGLNLALSDAGSIYYEPPPDRTMAYWNGVSDAYLVGGSTVSCRVSNS